MQVGMAAFNSYVPFPLCAELNPLELMQAKSGLLVQNLPRSLGGDHDEYDGSQVGVSWQQGQGHTACRAYMHSLMILQQEKAATEQAQPLVWVAKVGPGSNEHIARYCAALNDYHPIFTIPVTAA